jgi:hypothetical protein
MLNWIVVDLTMLLISTPYIALIVLFYMEEGESFTVMWRNIHVVSKNKMNDEMVRI